MPGFFPDERCLQVLFLNISAFLDFLVVWCLIFFSLLKTAIQNRGNSLICIWTVYSGNEKAGDETQGGRKCFVRVDLVVDSIK